MNKIILGCDPDSAASGFSFYKKGRLEHLTTKNLVQVYQLFERYAASGKEAELHIENLNGNNSSAFNHRARQSRAVQNKISESVGKCKQVQVEIERIAEHFGVEVVHHPVSNMWKKDKAIFEKVTGWTGRSNEDSRSGAYFGFLGCK